MNLEGKVAVITGGASGIGKALAHKYVSLGGRVVIADLNTKDGTQVATELNAIKPNSAIFAQCDVTQRASIENAVNTASKSFGRFDIMVNNAGIAFPTEDFVLESTEKWKKVVDINMMGVFYGTQIAIQELKKNDKGGLIINTASAAGIYPQYHAPIYAATKAAVVHLTRSLKNLQKDFNIRVVAVCPTYTVTPLITTHGPDVLKFMESQSGGLMTTDDVINVFVELTFDLKKKYARNYNLCTAFTRNLSRI
jgi:15-hydroxyprostaglandin dehydrogenase (NAD)